jgi:hypothetical protein
MFNVIELAFPMNTDENNKRSKIGANDIVVEAAKSMALLKQTMSMMISLKQMKLTT